MNNCFENKCVAKSIQFKFSAVISKMDKEDSFLFFIFSRVEMLVFSVVNFLN